MVVSGLRLEDKEQTIALSELSGFRRSSRPITSTPLRGFGIASILDGRNFIVWIVEIFDRLCRPAGITLRDAFPYLGHRMILYGGLLLLIAILLYTNQYIEPDQLFCQI